MASFNTNLKLDTYKYLIDKLCDECNYFGFIVSIYEYIDNLEKQDEYNEYVKK